MSVPPGLRSRFYLGINLVGGVDLYLCCLFLRDRKAGGYRAEEIQHRS